MRKERNIVLILYFSANVLEKYTYTTIAWKSLMRKKCACVLVFHLCQFLMS